MTPSPPPLLRWAYRTLGWRLGPSWHAWVRADLERPGWTLRQLAAVAAALVPAVALLLAVAHPPPARLVTPLVLALGISLLRRRSLRERTFRLQGLEEVAAADGTDDAGRRRANLLGAAGTVGGVLGALLVLTFAGPR